MVRRGLAVNFCEFEPVCDLYSYLPEWARTKLTEHRDHLNVIVAASPALALRTAAGRKLVQPKLLWS